jgi:homoserine acetyltransferase
MAQGESSLPSELKFGDLWDFKLESGAIIRNCQIGYHTLGKLNYDKSNVVLWPTWFTGSSEGQGISRAVSTARIAQCVKPRARIFLVS